MGRTAVLKHIIGPVMTKASKLLNLAKFPGSAEYWESIYQRGKTSGPGTHSRLGVFKAEQVNQLVSDMGIESVIEFGCGDGHQLSLMQYPQYIGLDVSKKAIQLCRKRFDKDESKSFFLYDPFCFVDRHETFRAQLALSLDVVYHLVEDDVYEAYLSHLFGSALRVVVVYSTNYDEQGRAHVRHRQFTNWVDEHGSQWHLTRTIENRFPPDSGGNDSEPTSPAQFFVFEKHLPTQR